MDSLERTACTRPGMQSPLSPTSCSYGVGRFLPRSAAFSDCMQGGGGYTPYGNDWGLVQGVYSHTLCMERPMSSFRASTAHYFLPTKDVSSVYTAQHAGTRNGGYDSVANGGYPSLCGNAAPSSPSSSCLSPDLDKKENKPGGKYFFFRRISVYAAQH